jgi:hypothetical protein
LFIIDEKVQPYKFNVLYKDSFELPNNFTNTSIANRMLIESFYEKGQIRGHVYEKFVSLKFGIPVVSVTGNDPIGDLFDYNQIIECRTITKNGTYVVPSSNAGSKRDIGKTGSADIKKIQSKVFCFGYFDENTNQWLTMFRSGDYVATQVEKNLTNTNYKFAHKKAMRLFLGIT